MDFELVEIGYTLKPHGYGGEIKLSIEEHFEEAFEQATVVFIKQKGQQIPYFIESVRGKGVPIVKFEGINSKETCMFISSKPLSLKREDIEKLGIDPDEMTGWDDFVGFQLEDTTSGKKGTIIQIMESSHQITALVKIENNEHWVPLVEDWIEEIDEKKKYISIELPIGLFDL